jgi:hypothetical protein
VMKDIQEDELDAMCWCDFVVGIGDRANVGAIAVVVAVVVVHVDLCGRCVGWWDDDEWSNCGDYLLKGCELGGELGEHEE